ncbi:MAG TPA: DUF3885 domain-containing protein [Gaiellaceae bacterium]|nr:DUF3885 domain-containing protein [Gaiellaceae bacterium]
MSDATRELARFLGRRFPGLTFPAVTGRDGPFPSLRLELGGGLPCDTDDERDKRVRHSTASAIAVFEAAFSPGDDGFVSFTRWREEDDNVFLALLPSECDVERTEGEDFYEQSEPDAPHVTYTACIRPRSIDYPALFELTASAELRGLRTPSLDGRCYLVNATIPRIFHMYDDRGAMLVATRDADLNELRLRYRKLIIP